MAAFWFCSHVGALWLDNKGWKKSISMWRQKQVFSGYCFLCLSGTILSQKVMNTKKQDSPHTERMDVFILIVQADMFERRVLKQKKSTAWFSHERTQCEQQRQTQCGLNILDHTSERLVLMVAICIGLFKQSSTADPQ